MRRHPELYLALALAAACSPVVTPSPVNSTEGLSPTPLSIALPPTPGEPPTYIPEPIQEPIQVIGEVPGTYSEFIRQHDLVPKAFAETDTMSVKLQGAFEYGRKLQQALAETPKDQLLPPVETFNLTDPRLFPIDLSPDATAYDIVTKFLADIDTDMFGNTRISFSDRDLGDPDPNVGNYLLATENFYLSQENADQQVPGPDSLWQRLTVFYVGKSLLNMRTIHETESLYYTMTDAELFFLFLHEAGHTWEDDEFLKLINADSGLRQRLYDEGHMTPPGIGGLVTDMANQAKIDFNTEFGSQLAATGSVIQADTLGLRTTDLNPNEAQCNFLAYYVLKQLNVLNGSTHLPGTGFQNPTEAHIKIENQWLVANGYLPNPLHFFLYSTFDKGLNALDPEWLIYGGQ